MNQLTRATRYSLMLLPALYLFPQLLSAHGVSLTDQQLLMDGSWWTYAYVGARHMLTGYDHLLFLVGVVFFLHRLKDILLFITAFTVGHSITLIGATLLGIQADDHLIDAVIALSVVYKGFENIGGFPRYLRTEAPNLLLMVFGFGLIHGFGLSTRLQHLALSSELTLSNIIAFNVGVESGQILALVPVVLIINFWRGRKTFTVLERLTNWGLIFIGIGLFVYQLVGYFGHSA